jgi:hypothetical protein
MLFYVMVSGSYPIAKCGLLLCVLLTHCIVEYESATENVHKSATDNVTIGSLAYESATENVRSIRIGYGAEFSDNEEFRMGMMRSSK